MKKFLSTATISLMMLTSYPAYAQDINDAGAQELKALLDSQIEYVDKLYSGIPELQMNHTGETTVTPQGTYYNVKMPHYSLNIADPGNPTKSLNIDFGSIAMNVTPQGEDAWSMSMALPMPIEGKNGDGEKMFSVNIGHQTAHALFIPSLQTSPKYHISYKDIVISDIPGGEVDVRLDEFTTNMKLEKTASSLWSGPATFVMKNLKLLGNGSKGNFNVGIDTIKMDAAYREFDLASASKFYKDLGTLDPATLDEQQAQKMMNDVFSQLFQSMDGMDTSFSLNGLKVAWDDKNKGTSEQFQLGKAGFGFTSDGLRGDNASLGFEGHFNGITLPDMPAEFAGFIPENADYEVKILNLPIQKLMGLGQAMLESAMQGHNPQGGMMNAVELMSQAGTKLVLVKQNFNTPEIGVSTTGEMKPDFSAPMKVVADFTMVLRNLDELMQKYGAQAAQLPPTLQQIVMPMAMLQQLGTQGQDPATGQSTRTFVFKMTETGQMMLNNQDMMQMMGGMMMQQQQQPRR